MTQQVIMSIIVANPGIDTMGIREKLREQYGERFDDRQARAVSNRLSYMKSRNYITNHGGRGEYAQWYEVR